MDKRLHSRLANPQNYIMPTYRINNAWKQEEARIISEQAQKDALQQQATQEAARAIANLERQEAERNPWIAASKMTAIQGVDQANNLQTRSNAESSYNLTDGIWGGTRKKIRTLYGQQFVEKLIGNEDKTTSDRYANLYNNQIANLSSVYGEQRHWYDIPTDEGEWMQNLERDKAEWEELEKYRDDIMEVLVSTKRDVIALGLAITMETAILLVEEKMPIQLRKSAMMLMLELTVCQALVIATDKWKLLLDEHMRKYNCSREEAERDRRLLEPFVLEVIRVYLEYFVEFVLRTIAVPTKLSGVIKGILSWFLSR